MVQDGFTGCLHFNGENAVNGCGLGATCDATSLNKQQIADAKYYADGTINQVLADRAATAQAAAGRAAREKAFLNEGSRIAGSQIGQVLTTPPQAITLADASFLAPATALDQNIVLTNPRDFSAGIRSIEIDGNAFQPDEKDQAKRKKQ